MSLELLTPAEMGEADRLAIGGGPFDGMGLMRNAGGAVAAVALARHAGAKAVHVLCGPGNNGGDGYVVARLLAESGMAVRLWREGLPRAGSDAAIAGQECRVPAEELGAFEAGPDDLVVDALFGAGLSKPLDGASARAAEVAGASGVPVLAIDLPSGLSGLTGRPLGPCFEADATVTFFRKKPGHLLQPGRALCGDVLVADIGIPAHVLGDIAPRAFENAPPLWSGHLPRPGTDTYKYARGHVAVFSGGPSSTGAARMAAAAAGRAGAGAVTLLSPAAALQVNAAQLTSTILRRADTPEEIAGFLDERNPRALVYGPGLGNRPEVGEGALALLRASRGRRSAVVLDADALTTLAGRAADLAAEATAEGAPTLVLTPHEGEFRRLFPGVAADAGLSKLERARRAAALAGAVVVYKGPDTVIAAPDGMAAINANGTPWLATAGSGDVLCGIVAGLLAQGMPPFHAASAAVWMHAEAAARFGPGLIAEDLPLALLPVLRDLYAAA